MAEKKEFASLLGNWRAALVLLTTFGMTILQDLTAGIVGGCGVAALCWASSRIWRRLRA
jgi:SulP family sulfate permease